MELRHLRYFRAVAELLNFSRAAERLHIAQPALSRQIRALEEELGASLLERQRVVRLTEAGRVFYTHTCKILAQVETAAAAALQAAAGGGGELIVCSDWRVAGQFLPALVEEFHRKFPKAEVSLRDMRFHDQLSALRARRAHLGFVVRDVLGRARELETLLVLRSRLMITLPSRHPRAGDEMLKVSDLAAENWVILDEKEAPGYRTYVNQLCRLSGFVPKIGHVAATHEGMVGRVASGFGVALALDLNAPHHNKLVRVRPLDADPLELCAVWHRKETSPLLAAFVDIVRGQVPRGLDSDTPATKVRRSRTA